MSILGQTTQSLSREALLAAAKAAQTWDRTHKEEIDHEREISESRGVSDTRAENRGERADEQVRPSSEDVPSGEVSERVHIDAPDRSAAAAPEGDRGDNRESDSTADGRDGEDRPSSEQGSEQRSMDTAHEEVENESGGTDPSDNSLRIEEEDYPDASEYGIEVNFPNSDEQAVNIASSSGILNIPQEEIDQILTSDFEDEVNLLEIREYFEDNPAYEEAIHFLRETYEGLNASIILTDGRFLEVEGFQSGLYIIATIIAQCFCGTLYRPAYANLYRVTDIRNIQKSLKRFRKQ